MIARIKCWLGFHQWRRSRFVALGQRTANLVCVRCGLHKETP